MPSSPLLPRVLGSIAMAASAGSVALNAVVASQASAPSSVHISTLGGAAVSGLSLLSLAGLSASHFMSAQVPARLHSGVFAAAAVTGTGAAAFGIMAVVFLGQVKPGTLILDATPVALLAALAILTLIAFLAQLGFLVSHVNTRRPGQKKSDCEAGGIAPIKSIRYSTTLPPAFSPVSSTNEGTLASTVVSVGNKSFEKTTPQSFETSFDKSSPVFESELGRSYEKTFDIKSFSQTASPASIRSGRSNSGPVIPAPLDLERVTSAALSINTIASSLTVSSPVSSPLTVMAPLAPRPSSRVPKRVSVDSIQSTRSTTTPILSPFNMNPLSSPSATTISSISSTIIPSGDLGFDGWDITFSNASGSLTSLDLGSTTSIVSLSAPSLKNKALPSRLLETIPQSPTIPLRSGSPSYSNRGISPSPMDLPPTVDPDVPRGRGRSRTQGSATMKRPMSGIRTHQRTASAKPAEAHIHPLFRSDSPGPPPLATPGTVVLAAPEAGRVLASRVSIHSLRRIRSGSLPAIRSSLSRQSSVDDFTPMTLQRPGMQSRGSYGAMSVRSGDSRRTYDLHDFEEHRKSSLTYESSGSEPSERALTPTIPDWVLNKDGRRREEQRLNSLNIF